MVGSSNYLKEILKFKTIAFQTNNITVRVLQKLFKIKNKSVRNQFAYLEFI
jgi:hypothetical protein